MLQEIHERFSKRRPSAAEAAEWLGVSERTFRHQPCPLREGRAAGTAGPPALKRSAHRKKSTQIPMRRPLLSNEEMDRVALGARIRRIRRHFGLSQPAFADRFHFPVASLCEWEQGRRTPDAATRAYLPVIEREPEAVMRALRQGEVA